MKKIKEIKWFVVRSRWQRGKYIGWGNGYVIIPKGLPGFGMHHDEIHSKYNIDAPGGLTFSSSAHEVDWEEIDNKFRKKNYWIVGFDTCHHMDTLAIWPKERVEEYAAKLAFQFYELAILQERNKNKS